MCHGCEDVYGQGTMEVVWTRFYERGEGNEFSRGCQWVSEDTYGNLEWQEI